MRILFHFFLIIQDIVPPSIAVQSLIGPPSHQLILPPTEIPLISHLIVATAKYLVHLSMEI